MFEFFRSLFKPVAPSGETAKERLKLVLLSDHLSLAPEVVESLKRDLMEVISRYVEIDSANADVTFEHREREIAMLASIPITAVRERKAPQAFEFTPRPVAPQAPVAPRPAPVAAVEMIVEPIAAEPEPVIEPKAEAEPQAVAEAATVAEPEVVAEPERVVRPEPVVEPTVAVEAKAIAEPEAAVKVENAAVVGQAATEPDAQSELDLTPAPVPQAPKPKRAATNGVPASASNAAAPRRRRRKKYAAAAAAAGAAKRAAQQQAGNQASAQA